MLIAAVAGRTAQTRHAAREEMLLRLPETEPVVLQLDSLRPDSPQFAPTLSQLRTVWHERFASTASNVNDDPTAEAASAQSAAADTVSPQLLRDADALLARWVATPPQDASRARLLEEWSELARGSTVVAALEQLVSRHGRTVPADMYDSVLPRLDSTFDVLNQLGSVEVQQRARGAELRHRRKTATVAAGRDPASPNVRLRTRRVGVAIRAAGGSSATVATMRSPWPASPWGTRSRSCAAGPAS
ncbi:MAG: hypothetical protein R3C10_05885 [Pirellulales bacterium]